MSGALWPGLIVAGAAWLIAGLRVRELVWRAPVDAEPLVRELARRLGRGDTAHALSLCDALPAAWGAEVAARALRAAAKESITLRVASAELVAEFAHTSQRGLDALRALGRIAMPLGLGAAIIALGAGFQVDGATGDAFATAQHALRAAVHALTLGAATTVFCRAGSQILQGQAAARLAEVRHVAQALAELARDSAGTSTFPAEAAARGKA